MHPRLPLLALAAVACSGPARAPASHPPPPPPAAPLHATIRWTSDGVPHVTASDLGGLGFGQGWALARLHLCELADQVVRVDGERAAYFGAGPDGANVESDFFHRHLGFAAHAPAAVAALSADGRAVLAGFAAGVDEYLRRTPPAQWPRPCRGAAWVRPVAAADLMAIAQALATTTSSRALAGLIANAAPRAAGAARAHLPAPVDGLASNAWALGADRTTHGGGLLVGNPHFPWTGALQFTEVQLTIPGQLDVYGAGLLGLPLVDLGFNARIAWSHTFSAATHFVVYRLRLAPHSPYRYLVGDGDDARPIVPARYTIDVRQPDGSVQPLTRTLYRSDVGPMLDSAELPWDPAAGTAYAVRDVALEDGGAIDQYLAMARATDLAAFEAALAGSHTWFVNTVYADADGNALYVDGSRVPALSPEAVAAWELSRKAVPALAQAWRQGVVVLDGSNPLFDLATDDPRAPGAVPVRQSPRVLRRDFVMNANDSHRWTNPAVAPAELSPLWGDEAGPSPRTLANLYHLGARRPTTSIPPRLDRTSAAAALLSNQSFTALALKDEVVAQCQAAAAPPRPRAHARGAAIATTDANPARLCAVLAAWDGRFTVDARGAALWRELLVALATDPPLWATPYDPVAPSTPLGLAHPEQVAAALRTAAARLTAAGVALDAPLGQLQRAPRGDAQVAIPGGTELDGVANVATWVDLDGTLLPRAQRPPPISPSGLGPTGYPINFGTSFVFAVDLTADGPHADALLTYGNSGDPDDPHHRDQLDALAAGRLRPVRFTPAEIAADPALVTENVTATTLEAP